MKNVVHKIDAIIFDMDGTIVQSNGDWTLSIVKALEKRGIPLQDINNRLKEIDDVMTGIDVVVCAQILRKMFPIRDTDNALRKDLLNFFKEQITETLEFVPGFSDFHKILRENNIKSCIATNSYREYFAKVQKLMGLNEIFGEHLYCVEDVNRKGKPRPDIFLYSAKKLGANPENCLVFEDSQYGFMAAKAANMKCIAIENSINKNKLDIVHGSISHYNQAVEVIKKILNNQT